MYSDANISYGYKIAQASFEYWQFSNISDNVFMSLPKLTDACVRYS